MSLSSEDVKKIAMLARVAIQDDKIDAYARDLSGILDFVEQMSSLNTENVQAMAHPMDQAQRLRLDEVTETDQRELFQAQAPLVEAGLYLVPQVIE